MRLIILLCLCLAACTNRPLTETEAAFLATTHGGGLDTSSVRITKGNLVGQVLHSRPARPQIACRERIYPPEEPGTEIKGSVAGIALFDRLLVAKWLYRENFLTGYPETLPLPQAMFLAHEATHIWQWQNRAQTGYAPWKAAAEHARYDDPYLFTTARQSFLDYPYEQQASLVEEYVCCRALDPSGARTERLRALLMPYFPDLATQSGARKIALPWRGVQVEGICS
ncbi:MAG: hypothetical protein ACPGNV_05835 [Mangrovicoccus sp.]